MTKLKAVPLGHSSLLGGLLCFVVFASSCSLNMSAEKRRYRPGFHVEVGRGKKKPATIERSTTRTAASSFEDVESECKAAEQIELVADASTGLSAATLSTVAKPAILSQAKHPANATEQSKTIQTQPTSAREASAQDRTAVVQVHTVARPTDQPDRPAAWRGVVGGFGFGIMFLGLLVVFFVSIIPGVLIILLGMGGVIASAIGSGRDNKPKAPRNTNLVWQDVVYLKNGSIIRGMVIEQVPSLSLKIQTVDGSVFVYTMDQVEKITKEQR